MIDLFYNSFQTQKKDGQKTIFFLNPRFEEETKGDPRLLPKEDNSTMATNCIAILVAKYRIAGMTFHYFFRNSLIPAAALRPSPIAKMTVAAPSTMSPPA